MIGNLNEIHEEAGYYRRIPSRKRRQSFLMDRSYGSGVVTANKNKFYIHTLEGDQLPNPGKDYIIKGVRNELYPCKKDIFEETYTKVVDYNLNS